MRVHFGLFPHHSFAPLFEGLLMKTSSRRLFLHSSAIAAASLGAGAVLPSWKSVSAAPPQPTTLKGRLYKTLKIGMVKVPGSLTDKFRAAKEAGFDGIELNAPGIDVEETRRAIAETGLPVDGSVNSSHWQVRHTDPDPAVRAQALDSL
ncbi:MAG: hypothetical protein KDA89_22645, partial [Planctomycetaceae bacterium]|nr:hypothetical protein [Planctomycetaceae bacterium]